MRGFQVSRVCLNLSGVWNRFGNYSIFDADQIISFSEFPKNHELLEPIKRNPVIPRLINLSEGWYTIEKTANSLLFNDLRFGQMGIGSDADRFIFSYTLSNDSDGHLIAKEREKDPGNALLLLNNIFTRALGNKQ